jgi:hypothetical protein
VEVSGLANPAENRAKSGKGMKKQEKRVIAKPNQQDLRMWYISNPVSVTPNLYAGIQP